MHPSFGTCEKKRNAREITIIKPWRELSGLRAIPEGRSYVTLCGPMSQNGHLLPGSEFRHMIQARLIRGSQFYGVERERSIHYANKRALARYCCSGFPPKTLCGELTEVLPRVLKQGVNPAILNIDTMVTPKNSMSTLVSALHDVSKLPGPMLIVWNTCIRTPRVGENYREDLEYVLYEYPSLKAALRVSGFKQRAYFEYPGTGKFSSTLMGSVVFWKPEKSKEIQVKAKKKSKTGYGALPMWKRKWTAFMAADTRKANAQARRGRKPSYTQMRFDRNNGMSLAAIAKKHHVGVSTVARAIGRTRD
jgi:hypothetical protein